MTATSEHDDEFGFLRRYSTLWHNFEEARKLVRFSPDGAVRAARVVGELLATEVAEKLGSPRKIIGGQEEKQHDLLVRLTDSKQISRLQANLFFSIKGSGNSSSHGKTISTEADSVKIVADMERLAMEFRPLFANGYAASSTSTPPRSEWKSDYSTLDARDAPADEGQAWYDAYSKAQPAQPRSASNYKPPPPKSPPSPSAGAEVTTKFAAFIAFALVIVLGLANWAVRPTAGAPPQVAQQTSTDNQTPAPPSVTAFPSPVAYEIVPGGHLADANVRSGPSWTYPVVMKLPRGAVVTGMGRAVDSDGVGWVQLSADQDNGYMKEDLLVATSQPQVSSPQPQTPPPSPPTPDQTQQAPPPQAPPHNQPEATTQPTAPAPNALWIRFDCEGPDGARQCRWCPNLRNPNFVGSAPCYMRPEGEDLNAEADSNGRLNAALEGPAGYVGTAPTAIVQAQPGPALGFTVRIGRRHR